ncbi:TPA: hypothetical protein ACGVAX_002786 [Vibrio vulnificus]
MLNEQSLEHIAEYFGVIRKEELQFWKKLFQSSSTDDSDYQRISDIGSSLYRVLAVVSLIAAQEKVSEQSITKVKSDIFSRIIRRLSAVTSLSDTEVEFVKERLDIVAGLMFVERKLDWCVWIYRSKETKVVPSPSNIRVHSNINIIERAIGPHKLGVSTGVTYVTEENLSYSSAVRDCLAAYGLYINSHFKSVLRKKDRIKLVSSYLLDSAIASCIGINPEDVKVPRQGIVRQHANTLDRYLADSFLVHLEKNTLETWLKVIFESNFYLALDSVIEGLEVQHSENEVSDYEWDAGPSYEKVEDKLLEKESSSNNDEFAPIADYEWSNDTNVKTLSKNAPPISKVESKSTFRWPSTIAFETDGSLPEVQWPQMGVLKAVGYTVGAQGLPQAQRLAILKNVYMEHLPYVESRAYMNEWGEPQSSGRLRKMAETLASLTKGAKRKTQANMSRAIRDWENDLAWLKEEYYLKHKYVWVWPSVRSKEESTRSVVVEKSYQSSREFLAEQYTNKANELCCQICQSALPFKLESGEYYWEETPVFESLEPSPFSDLVLCPNHRAMYLHGSSKPDQLLEAIGDGFSKQLEINLASEQLSIFVSELHQEKLRDLADSFISMEDESLSVEFGFDQISKGLRGVKKLFLYQKENNWVVSSRAKVINLLSSKQEAMSWIKCFDLHRGITSKITEEIPTSKAKINSQTQRVTKKNASVAAVRFGTVKKVQLQSSYESGYALCTTCYGDGGINGGCWKCGGSGWM